MTKFSKFFMPVAMAAVAFVSCQKEMDNPQADVAGTRQITVKAVPEALQGDATKTYIDDNKKVLWGTGEYMTLAVTGESTVFATSGADYADSWNGDDEAYFGFTISEVSGSEFLYQGLYPASAAVSNNNTNPAKYKVQLPATQNATASSYDPAAYIMVAKPESFTSLPAEWTTSFRRATALNKITLKNIPEDIVSVEFTTPQGKYLAGRRYIDLATDDPDAVMGEIYASGYQTETITVNAALSGTEKVVWFTSWGVEIASGEPFKIVAKSAANSYTRTITANTNGIKFQEGYLNTLSVNMASAEVETLETPVDYAGYYLIGYKPSGAWIIMDPEQGSNTYYSGYTTSVTKAASEVDFNTDFASLSNINDYIWKVEAYDGAYSIKSMKTNNYLALTANNNAANQAATLSGNTKFTIDINGNATIESFAFPSRVLKYNSGSPRFAFYTSGQQSIYMIPATYDQRISVTLSFAEAAISKTTDNYTEFTGQTLTVSPNETAITSNITYAIDGDAIGTISAAGVVTLNGTTGTATVTASFAGDENYRPATASYEITVDDASVPVEEWVETAITALSAGDVIVIVGNNGSNYAMSNDNGTSNPPSAVAVTVSGAKLSGTIAANIQWKFGTASGQYVFYPAGSNDTWLYCTNTNNGVRVGTNDNKAFSIDDSGYLNNVATSRYVGIYQSQDWRCYTSINTNITGQSFKFYKKTTSGGTIPTPVTYNVTVSATSNGTVTASPSTGLSEDEEVTLTITPDANYELETLTVDGTNVDITTITDNTYSFDMPAHDVTVSATFKSTGAPTSVVYDFTGSDWSASNGTLTNGTVSFSGSGPDNFKMNSGYFMLGKSGAYINFPAYQYPVSKIVVTGRSGASASVVQNIYVGSTAVSTATTGATGTNTYNIDSAYQAAGTIYSLKVTSSHNTQITKIEVFFN